METIAVIGLGSMGKRRIRLLKNQLGKKVIGIDTNIERLTEVTEISYSVGQKNTCIFRN